MRVGEQEEERWKKERNVKKRKKRERNFKLDYASQITKGILLLLITMYLVIININITIINNSSNNLYCHFILTFCSWCSHRKNLGGGRDSNPQILQRSKVYARVNRQPNHGACNNSPWPLGRALRRACGECEQGLHLPPRNERGTFCAREKRSP